MELVKLNFNICAGGNSTDKKTTVNYIYIDLESIISVQVVTNKYTEFGKRDEILTEELLLITLRVPNRDPINHTVLNDDAARVLIEYLEDCCIG